MRNLITYRLYFALSIICLIQFTFAQNSRDKIDLYFDAILDKDWKTTDSLYTVIVKQFVTKEEKADLMYYKGFEYYHREDYQAALENYLKARKVFIEYNDLDRQAELESAIVEVIGYLENDLVDYRPYLNSLCAIAETTRTSGLLFDCEYYRGYFKEIENQFDEALYHYKETSQLTLKFQDTLAYFTTQINVGKMLIATESYNEGLEVLEEAQQYYSQINNIDRNFLIILHKSDGYRGKKDFDNAIQELNKAKVLIKDKPSLQNQHDLYQAYAQIYEDSNQFENALTNYKSAEIYADSLAYVRAEKDIFNLKAKYEVVEKNNKIISLENENLGLKVKKKNNFITILIISNSLLFLLVLFSIVYRKYKKGQKEINKLQKQIDKLRHEKTPQTASSISLKNKTIINSKDILYIKSDGHYVEYYVEDKTTPLLERKSLTKTLKALPQKEFTRVHKSYVINLYRLKIINSTQLMLDNGEWIPLSRTYKPGLKDMLNKK